jgi:hypothetical protein
MLRSGRAEPYFIVPNINPFRRKPLIESIPEPDKFKTYIQEDPSLLEARRSVKDAREKKIGIFDEKSPLMLEPFELRFLARREAPSRRVIDMTPARIPIPRTAYSSTRSMFPSSRNVSTLSKLDSPFFQCLTRTKS